MGLISGWVTNIIVFMLLFMVVDMLLPDNGMKKYVKVAVSLLLFSIILTPLFGLFSADFEDIAASFQESFQSGEGVISIDEKKREIQASQHAYTLKQLAVQMEELAEKELMERFGMKITEISLLAKGEEIDQVTVFLQEGGKKVATIEPVDISVKKQRGSSGSIAQEEELKAYLSSCWDIPEAKLVMVAEGRSDL